MDIIYDLSVLAHLFAMAAVIGGYFVVLRKPRPWPVMVWGGRILLLSGLLIVALGEAADLWGGADVNHLKIGIKLLVSLAVVATLEIAASKSRKNNQRASEKLTHAAGILATVNVLVAVLVPGFI
ncbi:hypothetical protein LTH96_02655 [Nesterenkonia sp. LB17]|uniref:hypothetical protein n=1 Tax=unclassified Nesterenkonia TaxID=2629769 RepID=UPI001F4C9962|nr:MULTISPECIES: hypothetical protein [unclassified Nesterenkonia]MCH8559649.1 hypothetical protein [Nesterenkonia sp. DZ6]MCH8561828.1 hypothetical protein [Nesterenkonia sp. YGD6]MCH8564643.1 hypothetical protein [Nesterenkonia sp. LB17]